MTGRVASTDDPLDQPVSGRFGRRAHSILAILHLCALTWVANEAAAQSQLVPPGDTTPAQQAPVGPPPDALEITGRQRVVVDAATRAERDVARLADTRALVQDLERARERQDELSAHLAAILAAEHVRPERTSRLRERALQQEQRLEALSDRIYQRLEVLGRHRSEWRDLQRTWSSWRESLRGTPDYALLEPEMRLAIGRIDAVVAAVGGAIPELLALQRAAAALQAETSQLAEQVAALRAGRRDALLRRDSPPLWSPQAWRAAPDDLVRDWRPASIIATGPYGSFLRENAARLALHLLLALAIAAVVRRLKRVAIPAGAWSGMLVHPWAVGIFAATAFIGSAYPLPPPLWETAVWTLLAGSGLVIAGVVSARRPLRLVVLYIAAIYPLFLLAEELRLPVPLFRLGLAAAAVAGIVFFGALRADSSRSAEASTRERWVLDLGMLMWMVVLAATLFGYHLLARWILHATVSSALVIFIVGFLVVIARGAIQTLLLIEAKGRIAWMRNIGVPLVERLLGLLQIVLVIGAALAVLDLWELTPAPAETWAWLTGIGVRAGSLEITLGRVLLGALAIYIAVQVSWLIRTFATSEVYPRQELERGVGDSINRLVNYAVITLGIMLALGALGVQLQNFAILAGALGIGIGFGLQNIVNNFVSGLILLFERPVRIGDTVVIGGEWGSIQKIGLRSTTVLTFDQSEMIVPNADLISEKVTNWTLSNPTARLVIKVGVAYGSDVSRVLEILQEATRAHPAVLLEPPPQALFTGFGDSSLDFEVRVWVQELRLRLEVQSALLAEVDRRFRKEEIEIPFPQRDLHIRSLDRAIVEAVRKGSAAE